MVTSISKKTIEKLKKTKKHITKLKYDYVKLSLDLESNLKVNI